MVDLIALTPLAGVLPVTIGSVVLEEVAPAPMFLVAPFKGQNRTVSGKLKEALGIGFPGPNEHLENGAARAIWMAGGQALIVGRRPDLGEYAAVTDQSDVFAGLTIKGADAVDVLARLVPVDLRPDRLRAGATVRTVFGHMMASVTPVAGGFEVLVMRSMAGTLVHELERAARGIQGRGKIIKK